MADSGYSGAGPDGAPVDENRLLRSRDDRMLAGVAGGLGRHFDVDPIVFRVGFAIAAFFGIGIVAYLALYIFVPTPGADGEPVYADDRSRLIAAVVGFFVLLTMTGGWFPLTSPGVDRWWGVAWFLFWLVVLGAVIYGAVALWRRVEGTERPGGGSERREWTAMRVVALIALILAMLALASILAVLAAWAAAAGGTAVLVVAAAVALVLLIAAIAHRPSRWLLVPALAIALPLAAVEASGIELRGGYGDRYLTPVSADSIPQDGYELAAGDMTVDLRNLEWEPDTTVEVELRMGIGRASVVVPEEICVSSESSAKVGAVAVRGDSDAGIAVDQSIATVPGAGPTLILDAGIEIGLLQVITREPDFGPGHEGDWRGRDEPPQPRECFTGEAQ